MNRILAHRHNTRQRRAGLLAITCALLLSACDSGTEEQMQVATPAAPARSETATALPETATLINAALAGAHRSDANKARDQYRNPLQTLTFFGLQPDMRVIEIWPGAGWYTEVLAPVLHEHGQLILAGFPEDSAIEFQARAAAALRAKLDSDPAVYGNVQVIPFVMPSHTSLGPDDSADMVLLSRHFHNLIAQNSQDAVLAAAFNVLKPGGVLAVIQHRSAPDAVPEAEQRDGYVHEDYVIARALAAGFELAGSSEVNANPNDSKDHPMGVWSLPPTLRACAGLEDEAEKADCEAHYRAIGESDRMTLKFIKPATPADPA